MRARLIFSAVIVTIIVCLFILLKFRTKPINSEPGSGGTSEAIVDSKPGANQTTVQSSGKASKKSGSATQQKYGTSSQQRTEQASKQVDPVEVLAAATTNLNPFINLPYRAPSMASVLFRMARTMKKEEMATSGQKMLESDNGILKATGAILLMESGQQLRPDIVRQLVTKDEPVTPLIVLGWMKDNGHKVEAESFQNTLQNSGIDVEAVESLVTEDKVEGSPGRAAIDLLISNLSREDAANFLSSVAYNSEADCTVRLKAVIKSKEVLDEVDYQHQIQTLREQAQKVIAKDAAEKPDPAAESSELNSGIVKSLNDIKKQAENDHLLWYTGLNHLANRVLEPEVDKLTVPVLVTDDIDIIFNSQTSLTLDMVALNMDTVLSNPNSMVQRGTSARIKEYLQNNYDDTDDMPEDQLFAIRRIESGLKQLANMERALPVSSSQE